MRVQFVFAISILLRQSADINSPLFYSGNDFQRVDFIIVFKIFNKEKKSHGKTQRREHNRYS